jgi:hypothetical protein
MDTTQQDGFTIFLEALRLISCPRQISEALSNKPSDSLVKHTQTNALSEVYYLKEDVDPPEGVPKPGTLDRQYTLEEKQAVLRANEAAIAKFKISMQVEWPDNALSDDGEAIVTYTLCRLITLQGEVFAAQDMFIEAAEALLDCVDVAVRFPQCDSFRLDSSFSYLLVRQCCHNLQTLEGKLVSRELRMVLDRMSQIALRIHPYWKTWFSNNNIYFSHLKEQCSNSNWRLYAAVSLSGSKTWGFLFLKLLAYNRQRFITALEKEYDSIINQVVNGSPMSKQFVLKSWVHFNWLNPEFMASFQMESLRTRVIFDLLMLNWAIRAYKYETSNYPVSLADLVPEYLDAIPADPFSGSTTYRYRIDADKYLLYSAGPEGTDSDGYSKEVRCTSDE